MTTAVSFAKVPLPEIGPLANQILARGWQWTYNSVDRVAHFEKQFPDRASAHEAESEIAEILGDYYVTPEELEQRATAGSPPPDDA